LYSSSIRLRSSAARRRSCMSRMAWAWISVSLKLRIRLLRALSALGNTEHHTDDCQPSYTVMGEPRRVGGLSLSLYVVLLLGPGAWLYRDARRCRARWAWGWIAWNVAAAIGCLALWASFELDLDVFAHTETLWPGYSAVVGWLAVQVLMMVVLPIVILTSHDQARTATA